MPIFEASRSPAHQTAAAILISTLLSSCGGVIGQPVAVQPRPIRSDVPVYIPGSSRSERPSAPTIPDSVALRDAVALALLHSPELAAFAWETRAREARVIQAGHFVNPVIDVMAEDIGAASANGLPPISQAIQPQTTVQLSQLVELGGKRSARQSIAARARELAQWDYEAARIAVLTRVTQDFYELLAAQQLVAVTAQTADLVNQMQQSVAGRVIAGVASPVEETRANIAVSTALLESNRAVRLLDAARRRLAANWGAADTQLASATGVLDVVAPLPSLAALSSFVSMNPDLARWGVEILHRDAMVSAERARRIPDVTVATGFRRFTLLGGNAFLIGASLPLPIFDRNAGGIEESRSMLAKAREERRAAEARVSARLAEAYRALATAHDEVTALRTSILPAARQTFDAVSEGYRAGKFGSLDVLDAQRTMIAVSGQYLRALADYHKAVADVEQLIGTPLTDVPAPPR